MELNIIKEEWKPIIINGSQSNYLISNQGNIWSLSSKILMSQSICSDYKYAILSHEQKKHKRSTHRLVAIAFIDNPNNLEYVNHKNGNKLDNRV